MIGRSTSALILVAFSLAIAGMLAVERSVTARWDGVRALAAALDGVRPFAPRISGGFRHGDPRAVNRGVTNDAELDLAIALIKKQVEDDTSLRSLRAAAIADLLTDHVDDAILGLTTLAAGDRLDAETLNDLSAALLIRDRADDAAGANDAAIRALRLRPSMPEALFNRALALERLGLIEQARDTWLAFDRIERSPAWRGEGKVRLGALPESAGSKWAAARQQFATGAPLSDAEARALVDAFPQQTRDWIADEALPTWGRTMRSAAAAVDDLLDICARLSVALAARGDPLAAEAVATLKSASGVRRLELARAYDAYGRGRAASDAYRFGEAKTHFTEAARLMRPSDPFSLWAGLYLATIAYQENRPNEAERGLTEVGTEARERNYPSLVARVDWVLSVLEASRGRVGQALAAQSRSRAVYERLGESENVAIIHSLSAELFWFLGDATQSWEAQRRALAMLPHVQRPARRRTILFTAFTGALRDNRPGAALDFHHAFLDASHALGSDAAVAEALLHRARAYVQLGRGTDAARDISAARALLGTDTDAETVGFLRAQLALVDADRVGNTDIPGAMTRMGEALSYFQQPGLEIWLARAYLSRAKLEIAAGDVTAAERDLRDGIDVFEQQRESVDAERLRIAYQDDAWGLFEALLDLQLASGRTHEAFALSERARARSLSDASSSSKTMPVESVAGSLPEGTVILYYAATARGLAGWYISRESQRYEVLEADGLQADIDLFRAAMERGRPGAAREPGTRLWARLIEPLLKKGDAHTLVIVPDGPLHRIPFAALTDDTGRPLVARHVIAMAPSARTYVTAQRRSPGGPRNSIFIAADPDRGTTQVPALPAATREARGVAASYRATHILTGKAATRRAVLSRLASEPVVHLATHAIAHPEFPELSRFLFAPEDDQTHMSILLAEDLQHVRMPDAQLVVLAACETAAGRTMRGEGTMSLARPFLVAGARTVVATLWPLDDRTSEALFTRLHRRYAEGASAAEALRAAQLDILNDSSLPPGAWAAAISLGG